MSKNLNLIFNRNNSNSSMNFLILIALLFIIADCQYNKQLAYLGARLSKMSYHQKDNILKCDSQFCKNELENLEVIQDDKKSIQIVFGFAKIIKMIIISIRGTTNLQNWKKILNIKSQKIDKCENCKAHSGFLKAALTKKQDVQDKAKNYINIYGQVPFFITGHSLGAALTYFLADQLKSSKINNKIYIYNFGSPRVGNLQYANYLTKQFDECYRVINRNDGVPHSPFKWLGYLHGCKEVWYRWKSKYTICVGDLKGKCSNQKKIYSLSKRDHQISKYVQLFEKKGIKNNNSSVLESAFDQKYMKVLGVDGFDLQHMKKSDSNLMQIQDNPN